MDKGGSGDKEKKKKETILDLSKYLEKAIRVKFSGGREGGKNFFLLIKRHANYILSLWSGCLIHIHKKVFFPVFSC